VYHRDFIKMENQVLYHFYDDGGYIPINRYKAIGQGRTHTLYYLERHYDEKMTMQNFAQLSDFIIRYIDNGKISA